ncbi:hypothetical protein BDA96_01G061300 [Sorghum bicolor]|uniref:Uncharacterized protein n=2 Tax=Sorghum bicolor TaxID=4558 RepID=A0A921RVJ7_SORBI|nr:hypothetical protein BDA96_01G061300 [Sorghum bicolor]OQU90845.1 hypothetical protein SORBI_3001G060001 [Sorghum bicolor]
MTREIALGDVVAHGRSADHMYLPGGRGGGSVRGLHRRHDGLHDEALVVVRLQKPGHAEPAAAQ